MVSAALLGVLQYETGAARPIRSSAREINVCGTARPIALAVLRLSASLNLVGSWTGRSPACSPRKMRSLHCENWSRNDEIAVCAYQGVGKQDEATVFDCKIRNPLFNLLDVVNAARHHLNAEPWRGILDRMPEGLMDRRLGMKDCHDPSEIWCRLLRHFEPFAACRTVVASESSDVVARYMIALPHRRERAALTMPEDLPNLATTLECAVVRVRCVGESSMSDQTRDFLVDWFSAHVQPLPAVQRLAEAVRLATFCRADATVAGIPLQEIEDVVGGDLILKLLQALDAAARLDDDSSIAPEMETLIDAEIIGS